MASTASSFVEIPFANLPDLLSLLNQKMPTSAAMYNIVQLSLIKRWPLSFSSRLYSFNGNLTDPEDAFILNIHVDEKYGGPTFVVVLHPETISAEMLVAMENLLDWSKPMVFINITCSVLPYFMDLIAKYNPGKHAAHSTACYSYLLTAEESLKLDSEIDRQMHENSASLAVRELSTADDVESVGQAWYWRKGKATEFIQASIASIASAGVYLNDELISWGIVTPGGTINALHTQEDYRRQGYADLTLKYLCKLNGTFGLHSIPHVHYSNSSSVKLMNKLGFVLTHTMNFIDNCQCSECTTCCH